MEQGTAKRIIVVGGGAAGMMAAVTAARKGGSVVLLEPNEKVGRKLYITGKGRWRSAEGGAGQPGVSPVR